MRAFLFRLLDRMLSQEVARANAAGQANRLQESRRRLDDVNAFLATHYHDSATHPGTSEAPSADPVYAQRSSPEPP